MLISERLNVSLSETVTSRMLTTTDVPLAAVALLEQRPWLRRLADGRYQLYDNGQWRLCASDQPHQVHYSGRMHPVAAHLWLLLLALLTNPVAPIKYQLDDYRCHQLLKVLPAPSSGTHRHDRVLLVMICSVISTLQLTFDLDHQSFDKKN